MRSAPLVVCNCLNASKVGGVGKGHLDTKLSLPKSGHQNLNRDGRRNYDNRYNLRPRWNLIQKKDRQPRRDHGFHKEQITATRDIRNNGKPSDPEELSDRGVPKRNHKQGNQGVAR